MEATTSSGIVHRTPVIGSMDPGSAARNPANGRITSDGIGMITLSTATQRATPKYPTASKIWVTSSRTGPLRKSNTPEAYRTTLAVVTDAHCVPRRFPAAR